MHPVQNAGGRSCAAIRALAAALEPLEARRLFSIITLGVNADAYVRGGQFANQNYGASSELAVKRGSTFTSDSNRDSFIKFTVTTVPTSITSAKLRLFGHLNMPGKLPVSAYGVQNSSWPELLMTANTKPAVGSAVATTYMSSTADGWMEWNITSYLQAARAAGKNAISVAVRSDVISDAFATFGSKESANSPQLVVATNGTVTVTPPPPTPTPPPTTPPPTTSSTSSLTVSTTGAHCAKLTWPSMAGASYYRINRRIAGGAWSTIADGVTGTSFVDNGLVEKTQYDYQIFAAGPATSQQSAVVTVKTGAFKMYNSLIQSSIDFSSSGIPKLATIHAIGYVNGSPDLATARYWARVAAGIKHGPNRTPILDSKGKVIIEAAPRDVVIDQEAGINLSTPKGRDDMIKVIAEMRAEWAKYTDHPEFKNLKIGIWTNFPTEMPWDLDDTAGMAAAREKNRQFDALAAQVDFITVGGYADTTDTSDLGVRIAAIAREARRYNKPVYVYVWPEFFEMQQELPPHDPIPGDQWRAILDIVRSESDGAVIWGGFNQYNPKTPWARVTSSYLTAPAEPVPATPQNFTVDPVGLHLAWSGNAPTARVRVERSLDSGVTWRAVGYTKPGANSFDDPGYRNGSFTPAYRIQAFNSGGISDYATGSPVQPSRDAFALNRALLADRKHATAANMGFVVTNLWDGRWVQFKDMAFRQNADHFTVRWRPGDATIAVWIDCTVNPDGSLSGGRQVGTIVGRKSDQDSPLAMADVSGLANVPGGPGVTHNVFLVSTKGLMWVDWLRFGGANDAPAPPRHLTAASTGSGVSLTWFDSSDDETAFQIERSGDKGFTWSVVGQAPANNPPNPTAANSQVSWTDRSAAGATVYSYRVSAMHGNGVALNPISDVASGGATRAVQTKFNADGYEHGLGVVENYAGELFHTELGASTPPNIPIKGAWVKYTGVDFGSGSNRITLDIAPLGPLKNGQGISFFIDRLDPAHRIGGFVPRWTGGGSYYDEESAAINSLSGVHDLYLQFDDLNGRASIRTLRVDSVSPVPDITNTNAGADRVKVAWKDSSPSTNGYVVQWRKVVTKSNPTPQEYIFWSSKSVGFNDRSLDVTGLKSNTLYEFRVVSKTSSGKRPSLVTRATTK